MKKIIQMLLLFVLTQSWGQIDFSNTWEDFYSYNNVKDFVKVENNILAISDNAFFSYNSVNNELHKMSSINGLSGESTSSIYYSKVHNKTIIGYKLKYNINDSFYFLPETSMEKDNLVKMYPFESFMNKEIKLEQPIIFSVIR